jgi:outer membrane lipoprotein
MNRSVSFLLPLLAMTALSACASRPVVTARSTPLAEFPYQVAEAPDRFGNSEVVWGGLIIDVDNAADHTEVTVLAYPLDTGQRPLMRAPTQGRFIALLPGYVERYDYAEGRYLTMNGKLDGSRVGRVEQHDYVFPLVQADHVHLWPNGFQFDGPRWHFGLGVGIHIR